VAVTEYKAKGGRRYRAILYEGKVIVASQRGFLTKKAAKDWLSDKAKELKLPAQTQTGTGFLDASNDYLDDMEARRQHQTYLAKAAIAKALREHMGGDFDIETLTQSDIDSYLLNRLNEAGPKAANRDVVELKALWNWLIRKNRVQSNPWRTCEPFPEEKFQRYVPSKEDMMLVRAVAVGQERDLVDFLYYTGARLGEACRLSWSDVDFAQMNITLWTRKRRGGSLEPRTMGMVKSLAAILRARWEEADQSRPEVFTDPATGRRLAKNTRWSITLFTILCERAGVKRFTAHCIRHFVATRLKDSRQATPFQIQNLLGHQNLSTTEKYLHELDVDREVSALLEDDENAFSDKSRPASRPDDLIQ
jgi:integrase